MDPIFLLKQTDMAEKDEIFADMQARQQAMLGQLPGGPVPAMPGPGGPPPGLPIPMRVPPRPNPLPAGGGPP